MFFQGCLFHAHNREDPDCPISRGVEATPFGTPFDKVHEKRLERKRKLEALGVRCHEMFECAYVKEKEENEDLKEFLKTYHRQRPENRLTIRQGLRGGRYGFCKQKQPYFLYKMHCHVVILGFFFYRCETFRHYFSHAETPSRKAYYYDINRYGKRRILSVW